MKCFITPSVPFAERRIIKVKLSVAYNGDLGLIDKLSTLNTVSNLFGSHSKSVIGSGRRSLILPDMNSDDIENTVKKTHEKGMEFNYVMNSICMSNREYEESVYKEIVNQFDWLHSIGVDWVTLGNPYLIEVCKKLFPRLRISLSSFATIENINRAEYYDSLGIDEITVRENINREFGLLKKMKQSVSCEIQLLANQVCLYQCPYQLYHSNFTGHASQTHNESAKEHIDYSILKCNVLRFSDFGEIIKSCWIRPEDLEEYENIGIEKFKLSDRSSPTDWLFNVAKAYHERRYDGNLSNILNMCIGGNKKHKNNLDSMSDKNSTISNQMRKLIKSFMMLEVDIDNGKLDGFIEHFKKNSCKNSYCKQCAYCDEIAKKVITTKYPDSLKRGIDGLNELAEQLVHREGISVE